MGLASANPTAWPALVGERGLDAPMRAAFAELLREQLARAGVIELEAVGSSMMPTVPGGSIMQVEPLAVPLVLDELVAVVPDRGALLRCHRIVAIDARGYVQTRGDGQSTPDAFVRPDQIVGLVRRFKLGGKLYRSEPTRARPRPSAYRAQLQRLERWRQRLGRLIGTRADKVLCEPLASLVTKR